MLRTLFTTAAVFAAAAAPVAARADGPIADGKYVLSSVSPTAELAIAIVKVETNDGKPAASVVFVPQRGPAAAPGVEIRGFKATDAGVSFTVRTGGLAATDALFVGRPGSDPKVVLGSYGPDQRPQRAKLTATDKDSLTAAEALTRTPAESYTKAMQAFSKPAMLQRQAALEKDADKKKELQAQMVAARKEAPEAAAKFYRETVADHADSAAAYDAALALLRSGSKTGVTADEAGKLVALAASQAEKYGSRFARFTQIQAAEALADDKALAAVAVKVAGGAAGALTDADPAAFQVEVLTAYKTALANAGGTAELKTVETKLAKLETKLDQEYLATVPPFKPETFAGRAEKKANRVAVLELFTGAQCPPCVAADVAFDALDKTYKPADVVLLQYHMHIPGPDPMTNPATVARWDYYRGLFPTGVRGTPTTVFNGKPQAGGGGPMGNAEKKYAEYRKLIDPILADATPVAVAGSASRAGDKLSVDVTVTGADEADKLTLRLVVAEEVIKYVGGNKLRFHHHVVRATPGGEKGFAVTGKSSHHTTTVNVAELRKDLAAYLTRYAADERPFPNAARPLDLKDLKVFALVQNDKTGEIVQAAELEHGEKAAAATGR